MCRAKTAVLRALGVAARPDELASFVGNEAEELPNALIDLVAESRVAPAMLLEYVSAACAGLAIRDTHIDASDVFVALLDGRLRDADHIEVVCGAIGTQPLPQPLHPGPLGPRVGGAAELWRKCACLLDAASEKPEFESAPHLVAAIATHARHGDAVLLPEMPFAHAGEAWCAAADAITTAAAGGIAPTGDMLSDALNTMWSAPSAPDMLLLAQHLASFDVGWANKCHVSLALLRARVDAQSDAMLFYTEIIATICSALPFDCVWATVLCGVLPPLFRYLDIHTRTFSFEAVTRHVYDMDNTTRAAFIAALRFWTANPEARPLEPKRIADVVRDTRAHVRESLEHNAEEVISTAEPWIQAAAYLELGAALDAWANMPIDVERGARVCDALVKHAPRATDALMLYCGRAHVVHALGSPLARMQAPEWRDLDVLEGLRGIVLFLQLVAAWYGSEDCVKHPAQVFCLRARAESHTRSSLGPEERTLVDRWLSSLLGSDGIDEELLGYVAAYSDSPPWIMMNLVPSILQQLITAHQAGALDANALRASASYFLQPSLSYTVPTCVDWLIGEARVSVACANIAPESDSSAVYFTLLTMLLEGCPAARKAARADLMDLCSGEKGPQGEVCTTIIDEMSTTTSSVQRRTWLSGALAGALGRRDSHAEQGAFCAHVSMAAAGAWFLSAVNRAFDGVSDSGTAARWLRYFGMLTVVARPRGGAGVLPFLEAAIPSATGYGGALAAVVTAATRIARHLPGEDDIGAHTSMLLRRHSSSES